jgi:hypothetical protein
MTSCKVDVVVDAAGVIEFAVARELRRRHPAATLTVLKKV